MPRRRGLNRARLGSAAPGWRGRALRQPCPLTRSVDGTAFAGNKPGPMSTRVHHQYWKRRWDGWLGTPVR
jgi:hypothetical protein